MTRHVDAYWGGQADRLVAAAEVHDTLYEVAKSDTNWCQLQPLDAYVKEARTA